MRFTIAPELAADDDILEPLRAYVTGHATGDARHFSRTFLPGAHIEGLRDGTFVSWDLEEYAGIFTGSPADDESTRTRHLEQLDVVGEIGTAAMILRHGAFEFRDVFLLVRLEGEWRVSNKLFERSETETA